MTPDSVRRPKPRVELERRRGRSIHRMVASTQMPPGGIYTDARRWHLPRCHFCGSGGISPDDKVASPQMPKQTLNRRLASTAAAFWVFRHSNSDPNPAAGILSTVRRRIAPSEQTHAAKRHRSNNRSPGPHQTHRTRPRPGRASSQPNAHTEPLEQSSANHITFSCGLPVPVPACAAMLELVLAVAVNGRQCKEKRAAGYMEVLLAGQKAFRCDPSTSRQWWRVAAGSSACAGSRLQV